MRPGQLHEFLTLYYSLEELRTLCLELGIEYENLGGRNTRTDKARELLLQLAQEHRLEQLLTTLEKERPRLFHQDGLSTDAVAVRQLYDDLPAFKKATRPIHVRWLEKFRLEQRLGFVVLGIIVVGSIVALYLAQRPRQQTHMAGNFNVAVAGFVRVENGRSQSSPEGEQVGSWLATQLQAVEEALPGGFVLDIWGPEQTGSIQGETREERAQNAQILADMIGANIVIYGLLQNNGQTTATITPEFYVATPGFELAQEITGAHQMGAPISVRPDVFQNPVLSANLNRELNGRATALSHFTIGLIYFSLADFDAAMSAFVQAEQTQEWEDDQGKEIIYLFIGNTALNRQNYADAHTWFDRALELNSNYARAYVGKGFVWFQEAIQPLQEETNQQVDIATLDRAIDAFQMGLTSSDKPPQADVDWKAHFGLGRAYLVKSWQGEASLWQAAQTELDLVIEAYKNGNVQLQELAAQTFGQLGLLHYILGSDEEAIAHFEQAFELSNTTPFKAESARWLSRLYSESGDQEKATHYSQLADQYD